MDRRSFIAACGTILVGIVAVDVGPIGSVFVEDVWMVQVEMFTFGGIVLLKSKQSLSVGDFITSDRDGYVQHWIDPTMMVLGVVMGMKEKLS